MVTSGKILIKKKSGPGELTGITEIDLQEVDGGKVSNALFKELQFTEPGDYVITISCTNEMVESTDITVKVLKEDEFIGQPEKAGTEPKVDKVISGSRPIISQIDKPTIKIPEISMDIDNSAGVGGQGPITAGLGFTPFLYYHGFQISDRAITSLRLYHDGIIPKIQFTFMDENGILKDSGTPQDNTTMDLFLNSASANIKSIHFKFKITEFSQGKPKPGQKHTMSGVIDIPDLYVITNRSYNDTSFGTLRTISKELGIGFNSNIKDTDDKMSWRNTNRKPYDFIDDIVAHSYISDESFMGSYIDFYYCLNYVDIEKETKRDISSDIGIESSGMSQAANDDESNRLIDLILTNDKSNSSSCNFIESYKIRNDSTSKSLKEGYLTVTKTYDRSKKQFLVFGVDSLTSDGDKNIILKGDSTDANFYKNNVKTVFTGKLDDDNTHKNYNYAKTQNRINLYNLNKICINVKLPNANFNLYKFQKVRVDIINESNTPSESDVTNYKYSGEYIIIDIEYNWNGRKMTQELRLVKKELGKDPNDIKNDAPMRNRPEEKKVNENPVVSSEQITKPNEVYVVGQTYYVRDVDNKLYELTVKSLSENGIEVVGTIKETQRK